MKPYRALGPPDLENYFAQVEANYSTVSNSFDYYRHFVQQIASRPQLKVVPLAELLRGDSNGKQLVGLRHDIDADPVTAVRAARELARYGMTGSFYLLHSAVYYGKFHDEIFLRNPELSDWVRDLIVAGVEIGLHNDALGVLLRDRVDGASALSAEVRWLRSQGAVVRGTVGHNSLPVHGAENSEIFAGRRLWERDARSPDGVELPLERLSESGLGLEYEGTFARPRHPFDASAAEAFCKDRRSVSLRSESWMRLYLFENPCCRWEVDCQFWLIGQDEWVASNEGAGIFEWCIGLDRALEILDSFAAGTRSVFVVHPEYVRN